MRNLPKMLLLISLMLWGINAYATWSSGYGQGGHYVKNGRSGDPSTTVIFVESGKKAKKLAKKLNKIDKQDQKGVWDDGSGNCDDPRYNC